MQEAIEPGAAGYQTGLLTALVGDGRSLLVLVALGLIVSGIFALFLAATGTFLPHDVAFLGMQPSALCGMHQCRIVHFMFHDRVAFGGTLMSIGTLYLWLVAFPLRLGEEWAWWTMLLSGTAGFLNFLSYLIYGYLDSWHAVATAALLPLFIAGIWKTRKLLPSQREGWRSLLRPSVPVALGTRTGFGRACLLFVGAGMALAGIVITILGFHRGLCPAGHRLHGIHVRAIERDQPAPGSADCARPSRLRRRPCQLRAGSAADPVEGSPGTWPLASTAG